MMPSNWKWKAILVAASLAFTFYLLTPSFYQLVTRQETLPTWFGSVFPNHGMNLGLDLQGGMYLELDVDLPEALKHRLNTLALEMERGAVKENLMNVQATTASSNNALEVHLKSEDVTRFVKWVRDYFGNVFDLKELDAPTLTALPDGLTSVRLPISTLFAQDLRNKTLQQAEEAVRNRIDRYGVVEAGIQRQGESRLVVELPGVKDPQRIIDVIRRTGLLEFRLVDESIPVAELTAMVRQVREANQLPAGVDRQTTGQINDFLKNKIPADSEIVFEVQRDPMTKQRVAEIPYLLKKRADVTGSMLQNAQVGVNNNEPHVSLMFDKIGTKNFAELTQANIQKRLAIVLDGIVSMAPVIQTGILNGEAQITFGFGNYQTLMKEAEDVALLLREGALPASLTVATKTVIGPSLGADSIRSGLYSVVIASAVVFVFMMFYYRWGGVIASLAMILNGLFIFSILSLFQASLTLPGIAGIVLTMGMAVDANIIIFERMREERRLGKTPKAIVDSGYENAMSAIVDSNVTTLISGVILYQFGTGPIKGFATTLVIGIITTMFTAVFITRVIYDYFIIKTRIKTISV